MSFATLEEAWGVPTFGIQEVTPEHKQRATQDEVLDRAEASQRAYLFVNNYLKDVYERHGATGVLGLMDAPVARDVRLAALMSFDFMDTTVLFFVFMCLCGLWLLADMFGRRA
jgi:hypothetical protein